MYKVDNSMTMTRNSSATVFFFLIRTLAVDNKPATTVHFYSKFGVLKLPRIIARLCHASHESRTPNKKLRHERF